MRVIAGLPLRLVTLPCWGPTGETEQVEGLPVCPPWPASLPLLCVWEHLARAGWAASDPEAWPNLATQNHLASADQSFCRILIVRSN
uniref:Uncharacterized protein n=1 Tax=Macaca mulatta TaxID=9544 RepID=A0A5F8ACZ4_MACMU